MLVKSWMKWAAASVLIVALVPALAEARLHKHTKLTTKSAPVTAVKPAKASLMAVTPAKKTVKHTTAKKHVKKLHHHKKHSHKSLTAKKHAK